ncbi:phage virion morphogenesis protein [Aquifex sp.]
MSGFAHFEGFDKFSEFLKGIGERVRRVLPEIAPEVRDFIVENIKKGDHKENSPLTKRLKGSSKPLLDTGTLRASITYVINNKELKVGSNLVYAPVHQFGATVTPKVAKKLTIPATKKIRKYVMAMGIKKFIKSLEAKGFRVVFLEKSVIAVPPDRKSSAGGLKLKKGKGEVIFIRKEKVVIPARPYLYLSEEQRKYLRRRIIDVLGGT